MPAAMRATLAGGWNESPSRNGTCSACASSAPTVLLPLPATPITTTGRTVLFLVEALTAGLVEHVRVLGIDAELHGVVGLGLCAPVHHQRELRIAHLHQQLGLGAGRFDHEHLGADAVGAQAEVAGPDAVAHRLAICAG